MYQIDSNTAATVMPTISPPGPNPNGYFRDGDPSDPSTSTVVPAEWLNTIQGELCTVIVAAGIELEKGNNAQLLEAILALLAPVPYAASASSPNTYTATLDPAPSSYYDGLNILVKFANGNTGAATINLNALGAINIRRPDGTTLQNGDIRDGMIGYLACDGTRFQLINPNTTTLAVGNGLNKSSNVISVANTLTSVSTTTTLTSTAYYSIVVASGSSAYTITLPAASAGKSIDFQIATSSNALITVTPASGTISGQSNIIVGSGDSFQLYTDGTNWFIRNLFLQPASVRAYLNTSLQSVTTAILTKLALDATLYDTGGFFDVVTNHRYTPKLPGKYSIIGKTAYEIGGNPSYCASFIYLNGSFLARTVVPVASNSNGGGATISDIIYLNGSSDYIELYTQQNTGSNRNYFNDFTNNYLTAIRTALF